MSKPADYRANFVVLIAVFSNTILYALFSLGEGKYAFVKVGYVGGRACVVALEGECGSDVSKLMWCLAFGAHMGSVKFLDKAACMLKMNALLGIKLGG